MATRHVYYPTTISSVVALAAPGDTIIVHPGTYVEKIVLPSQIELYAEGEVIIRSTGLAAPGAFGACIEIGGKHDVVVDGFTIQEGGGVFGWSNSEGIAIRDLGAVGGTGSYNIIIRNCIFENIVPRSGVPDSVSLPLSIYSLADERLGHTNVHDILIEDCIFRNCNVTSTLGITPGYLSIMGNVENVTIKDCYFYHDRTLYGTIANGINFSGNRLGGYPDTPRRCRVVGNTFETPPNDYVMQQSCYLNVCSNIIVERNYFKNWSLGPEIAAEVPDLNTSYNIIIRRNIIESYYWGVNIGAFSDFYSTVYNIWVDSNTIRAGILVTALNGEQPTGLLFTNNIITGTITNDTTGCTFSNNTTEDVVRIDNLYTDTPSWVEYNTQELDYNGSKDKRTKGAVEQQWMQKRTRTRRVPRY